MPSHSTTTIFTPISDTVNRFEMSVSISSSSFKYTGGVSVKLHADGRNFKAWEQQLRNAATALSASKILSGGTKPQVIYSEDIPLEEPRRNALGQYDDKEIEKCVRQNSLFEQLNRQKAAERESSKLAAANWERRDAELQNIILSSIDTSHHPPLYSLKSSAEMYEHLTKIYASNRGNVRSAWIAFVDIRADAQKIKSVQQYCTAFQEALGDLVSQGITISCEKNDSSIGETLTIFHPIQMELQVTHFLHGLQKVLPDWVEDRYNDIRQNRAWVLEDLLASLHEHIRTTPGDDPVKVFHAKATKPQQHQNKSKEAADKGKKDEKKKTEQFTMADCKICDKQHNGGTKYCFKNPNRPKDAVKTKWEKEQEKKAASTAKANATVELPADNTTNAVANHVNAPQQQQQYQPYTYNYEGACFFVGAVFFSDNIMAAAAADSSYLRRFCYDTGANRHVFNNRGYFLNLTQYTMDIQGATAKGQIRGIGTAQILIARSNGTAFLLTLQDVLYCPEFATNVISQAPFTAKGAYYHSGKQGLYMRQADGTFTDDDDEIAHLPEHDGIPNFLLVQSEEQVPAALAYAAVNTVPSEITPAVKRPLSVWHHIFIHANEQRLKLQSKSVKGMIISDSKLFDCEPCHLSKSTRQLSTKPFPKPLRLYGQVHVDIVGPINPIGIHGYRYWMILTDGKTRRRWIYFADTKAALGAKLRDWATQQYTVTGFHIGEFHFDNAREFLSQETQNQMNTQGTVITTSVPYQPWQNGPAEISNAIVLNASRSALGACPHLPKEFWPYAAQHVIRMSNLMVTRYHDDKMSPLEAYNRELNFKSPVPNVSKEQAFGHGGYVHIPDQRRVKSHKFDPRSVRGYMVGMIGESIYEMYIPAENHIIKASSIRWDKYNVTPHQPQYPTAPLPIEQAPEAPKVPPVEAHPLTPPASPIIHPTQENLRGEEEEIVLPNLNNGPEFDGLEIVNDQEVDHLIHGDAEIPVDPPIRPPSPPRHWEIDGTVKESNILPEGTKRAGRGVNNRNRVFFSTPVFDRCLAMALLMPTNGSPLSSLPPEPRSYKHLSGHPYEKEFRAAMLSEFLSHINNGTWRPATQEEISGAKEIIPSQWVWDYKGDLHGLLQKHKARLVACGNRQNDSEWTRSLYAYVVRMPTLRVLIALVAYMDLECEQLDVITAYLNSHLNKDEVVYLRLPPGIPKDYPRIVRLLRGLYGLRQAAILWYEELKKTLNDLGYSSLDADPCVFTHTNGSIIIVYVDDLILITRTKDEMAQLKELITKRYKVRDLGALSFYLGIRFTRERKAKTISLSMAAYIDRITKEYHMDNAPFADSPLPRTVLGFEKNKEITDDDTIKQYQSLVAKLLYPTTICRPDAAWAVNFMARFASNPTVEQMSTVKRIIQYLNGTRDLGITYTGPTELTTKNITELTTIGLHGFTDAAFGDSPDRKSSAGYIFMLAGGAVSFKSFKQRIVTCSSTEAEFITQTYGAKEAFWIQSLLQELGYKGVDLIPLPLFSDCLPAVQLAHNNGHHERTKHIDIHYKWIRQALQMGRVTLTHVPATAMAADGLTKPLEAYQHEQFVKLINMSRISLI